jgi:hypothetical protein
MKPRLNDAPSDMPGLCTQAKKVDEFGNFPGTATELKVKPPKELKGTEKTD